MREQERRGAPPAAKLTVKSQYNEEMHDVHPPVDKEKIVIHLSDSE